MSTPAAAAVNEILISFLETQGITRPRAVELIAKDPNAISEAIAGQITQAQTALLQAALTPDQ